MDMVKFYIVPVGFNINVTVLSISSYALPSHCTS